MATSAADRDCREARRIGEAEEFRPDADRKDFDLHAEPAVYDQIPRISGRTPRLTRAADGGMKSAADRGSRRVKMLELMEFHLQGA